MENTQDTQDTIITKEILDAVKYHELKSKFEEIGVPEVWKPGRKKDELIKDALAKLAKIRQLKEAGVTDDKEIKEKIKEQEEAENKALELQKAKEEEAKQIQAQQETKEVQKIELTKEQILDNLHNIDENIRGGVKSHFKILNDKRNILVAELKERFDIDY